MYSKKATIDFYFNTRTTRSGSKKKEINSPENDVEPVTTKRLKTLSNPEEDDNNFLKKKTPEKSSICSPASTSSTIENRCVNRSMVSSSSSKKGTTISKNIVSTPTSSKKPPKNRRGSKSLAAVDHNKQYVIDAGQKGFDGLKTCNDCGMVYTKGIKEDELHHKTFHDSVVTDSATSLIRTPAKLGKGVTVLPSPKSLNSKIKSLKWSFNSKTMKERILEWVQLTGFGESDKGRIIGFTSDELMKNEKVLNLVDKYFRKAGQEIGIESGIMEYSQLFLHVPNRPPSIFLLMIVSESRNKAGTTPTSRATPKTIAATPKTKRSTPSNLGTPTDLSDSGDYVVGLISCESIKSAEKLISENPLSCSTDKNIPAKIGVSRIWVANAFRRRNVATQLLDALRRHFMTMVTSTSQVVPKDQVAFSDPTESGLRFAKKYFNREDILVFSLFHSLTPAPIEEL